MKIKICLYLIIISCIVACKSDPVKIFEKQKLNKEFVLPNTLFPLCETMGSLSIDELDNPVKIIHLFDGDCGCCINNLRDWELYMNSFNYTSKIDYIFITFTYNRNYLCEVINDNLGIIKSVFYIEKEQFLNYNNIPDNPKLYTYLLINGKIKAIGKPINNPLMKVYYEDQILNFLQGEQKY